MEKTLKQHSSNIIKVVLFGPESTGKTTLSRQLAAHYNTKWVPEFSRSYLQEKWDKENKICEKKDMIPIAKGQINAENCLVKQANGVLVCDTDLLELKVYSEVYYTGYVDPLLDEAAIKNTYDLYFLTYIDTPWEEDDLRDKPNERIAMFNAFKRVLEKHNRSYVLLKGSKETRLRKATEVIDGLIAEKSFA